MGLEGMIYLALMFPSWPRALVVAILYARVVLVVKILCEMFGLVAKILYGTMKLALMIPFLKKVPSAKILVVMKVVGMSVLVIRLPS